MSEQYAWSRDEDNYEGPCDSIEEAYADAANDSLDDDGTACPVVWIGTVYYPHAEAYINAKLVIDRITEQEEYSLETADDWPHANKEQLAELTRELQQTVGDWLDRHKLRERFFLVRDVKRYERVDGKVVQLKGGGA